ncbi:MAG: alpha/beta hydrolase [Betaproteobacteria bacterium]
MKRAAILASVALAIVAFLLLVVAPRSDSEIAITRDLTYGKSGDTELKLDLAMPKVGIGPFPAVVFLHGEGWRAGNRQQMNHFIEGMARLGYVAITVEYRLVPTARFPAQVEDCKAAVRWLRANAEKYHARSDRIGVVGFSAGGHLASMLGVTRKEDGFEGLGGNPEQSSRVQAVVSFFGPTDFSARNWPKDLEEEVIAPFLGGSFADKSDFYRRASPINYASAESPPFLFFHGTDDQLVPIDQSRRLAETLKKAGVPTRMVALEGEGHGFSDPNNQEAMRQMLDFLSERLKP